MCCYRNTSQLKCTSSHPVMNSLLSTYNQLHQPRFCMHFFSQATLIHQVNINITIIKSRIIQNRNNSALKLTFHLNNGFLMIFLFVVHNCINSRNFMTNVPNFLHLLSAIDLRLATLVQWTILLAMIFATYPTLQWSPTITSVLFLSRLRPMSLLNCIELLVRSDTFFLTYILRYSSLSWPLPFKFIIPLQFMLRLSFAL